MNETIQRLELFIEHSQQGSYFTLPFEMPEDSASLRIKYWYPRCVADYDRDLGEPFESRQQVNIIDLGLIAPDGHQVGASGSDKDEITIDEVRATPGYTPQKLVPGEWQIIVGAYKVEEQGVYVSYEVHTAHKELRLLKGDLHVHTLASDGVHTVEELAWKAKRNGLDFLAITDHNQMSTAQGMVHVPAQVEGITLIPGVEWTHYQGHANFLGVDHPYDQPFMANTAEEVLLRFQSARQRGALISVNHPFEPHVEFRFDLNSLPFDCLEVWNGPMRESNLKAVGLWHSWLVMGRKVPICGGSDYHRDTPFIFLGGPTTGVYSMSAGPSDILAALKAGHSYLTFAPNGPALEMTAGEAMLGDTVTWPDVQELQIVVEGLGAGDVVRVVTGESSEVLIQAPAPGIFKGGYRMAAAGFARVEVLRAFLPGVPMLPALISNPIFFIGEK
jgi:hypothetical protein